MIRTLIIDDEPLAREGIKLRLATDCSFQVIGEYGNGMDAVNAINLYLPDLVFLDIQMPEMDGFEVIKNIKTGHLPFIIFVTAYDKYALKAFEVHAVDYILKPINDSRFYESLKRVKEQIINKSFPDFEQKIKSLILGYSQIKLKTSGSALPGNENSYERIAIKSQGGYYFINPEEIEWIEAAGDYVYIHCNGRKHLHRITMQNMVSTLNSTKFQRIHRSAIVNLEKIKEIQPSDHGNFIVILCSGTKLKLSRNYKENFLSVLKIPL